MTRDIVLVHAALAPRRSATGPAAARGHRLIPVLAQGAQLPFWTVDVAPGVQARFSPGCVTLTAMLGPARPPRQVPLFCVPAPLPVHPPLCLRDGAAADLVFVDVGGRGLHRLRLRGAFDTLDPAANASHLHSVDLAEGFPSPVLALFAAGSSLAAVGEKVVAFVDQQARVLRRETTAASIVRAAALADEVLLRDLDDRFYTVGAGSPMRRTAPAVGLATCRHFDTELAFPNDDGLFVWGRLDATTLYRLQVPWDRRGGGIALAASPERGGRSSAGGLPASRRRPGACRTRPDAEASDPLARVPQRKMAVAGGVGRLSRQGDDLLVYDGAGRTARFPAAAEISDVSWAPGPEDNRVLPRLEAAATWTDGKRLICARHGFLLEADVSFGPLASRPVVRPLALSGQEPRCADINARFYGCVRGGNDRWEVYDHLSGDRVAGGCHSGPISGLQVLGARRLLVTGADGCVLHDTASAARRRLARGAGGLVCRAARGVDRDYLWWGRGRALGRLPLPDRGVGGLAQHAGSATTPVSFAITLLAATQDPDIAVAASAAGELEIAVANGDALRRIPVVREDGAHTSTLAAASCGQALIVVLGDAWGVSVVRVAMDGSVGARYRILLDRHGRWCWIDPERGVFQGDPAPFVEVIDQPGAESPCVDGRGWERTFEWGADAAQAQPLDRSAVLSRLMDGENAYEALWAQARSRPLALPPPMEAAGDHRAGGTNP